MRQERDARVRPWRRRHADPAGRCAVRPDGSRRRHACTTCTRPDRLPFAAPEHEGRFFSISLFAAAPVREAIADGRADYVPIFLSDIPALFTPGRVPLDVALVQLSPPDAHGYCTLGTSVDTALAAVARPRAT